MLHTGDLGKALICHLSPPTWNVSPGSTWCAHYYITLVSVPHWLQRKSVSPCDQQETYYPTTTKKLLGYRVPNPKVASYSALQGSGQPDPMTWHMGEYCL